ncbi:YgiW/YdeI family stress tolerance OB fold protein [Affinibrenneria salicis]|uniref:YgiW/YdeI family stress tolerance OB fold protein n=1 Tax=Affinibrenneria salicis TaxID=2590031 RepID=A0A5J5FQ90_9GAMM|nr:YgiW/YdeI family stress tolerance OB fold protein [Affinibrenneria salicis]KAA8995139.1 YgiW/YdeI family stress tolerance OB fold protein [Affinibrenneria salicis]
MKKIAVLFAIAALSTAPVFAAQSGGFIDPNAPDVRHQNVQGGFSGPDASITTVAKAKELKDDSWITLRGHIEQRTGDEDYLFRDESGSIKVEIDDKYWNGQTVTPADRVELQGELDKGFNSSELDVKRVKKMQ